MNPNLSIKEAVEARTKAERYINSILSQLCSELGTGDIEVSISVIKTNTCGCDNLGLFFDSKITIKL